jgi:yitT family protein
MANKKTGIIRDLSDYVIIALSMCIGSFGWCAFLLPHKIPIGGIAGISAIVFWGFDIPVQYIYFSLNACLLLAALYVLGWQFSVRTIYAVVVFTIMTSFFQSVLAHANLFLDEPFLACVIGGVFLGFGTGVALLYNASSGGSDVVAAMVRKFHDISLGRVILGCDLLIITCSYLILHNWEHVIYGYIVLFVMSFTVDYVINGRRGSVQFFIVSSHWQEIGKAIGQRVVRGCTVIEARGFYTRDKVGMLFVVASRSQARSVYRVIDEIDDKAFVSQAAVNAVYGMGFERMKTKKHKKQHEPSDIEIIKDID